MQIFSSRSLRLHLSLSQTRPLDDITEEPPDLGSGGDTRLGFYSGKNLPFSNPGPDSDNSGPCPSPGSGDGDGPLLPLVPMKTKPKSLWRR